SSILAFLATRLLNLGCIIGLLELFHQGVGHQLENNSEDVWTYGQITAVISVAIPNIFDIGTDLRDKWFTRDEERDTRQQSELIDPGAHFDVQEAGSDIAVMTIQKVPYATNSFDATGLSLNSRPLHSATMSDKPEIPKPVAELAKDASQQGATQNKDAPGSRLKAWKKPHNLHAYYGPPPHTYMKLPDKNPNEQTADTDQSKVLPVTPMENGYSVPNYRPPGWVPPSEIQGPTRILDSDQGATTHPGPTLSAVQEGKVPAVCEPHLQILCGPLLRYDTVKDGMWRANDDESVYHPFPTLTLEWEMEDEKPFTLDPPFEDGKDTLIRFWGDDQVLATFSSGFAV
ncbi:7310_t:CDS:2, partial [Acaulospora colombiana]